MSRLRTEAIGFAHSELSAAMSALLQGKVGNESKSGEETRIEVAHDESCPSKGTGR